MAVKVAYKGEVEVAKIGTALAVYLPHEASGYFKAGDKVQMEVRIDSAHVSVEVSKKIYRFTQPEFKSWLLKKGFNIEVDTVIGVTQVLSAASGDMSLSYSGASGELLGKVVLSKKVSHPKQADYLRLSELLKEVKKRFDAELLLFNRQGTLVAKGRAIEREASKPQFAELELSLAVSFSNMSNDLSDVESAIQMLKEAAARSV